MEIKINKSTDVNRISEANGSFPVSKERRVDRIFSSKKEIKKEIVAGNGNNEKVASGFWGKAADKIIDLSIFMIFFGVPLFFTGVTFQGIAFEKQIYFYFWILLAIVIWLARSIKNGEIKIRKTPLDIPIFVFWIAYLVSSIFSVDRWHSFFGFFGDPSRGFLGVTSFVAAYYFFFSHIGGKRIKIAFYSLIASGTLISFWTIIRLLDFQITPSFLSANIPANVIGSSSGLNIFMAALVVLIVGAILKAVSSENVGFIKKTLLLILFFVSLFSGMTAFVLVCNFSFWPAILIGNVIFLLYSFSRIVEVPIRWIWLPTVSAALFLAVFMLDEFNFVQKDLPAEISPSYAVSVDVVKNGLEEKFLLGSGPATYGYAFSKFKPQYFNSNQFYDIRFHQGSGLLLESIPAIGLVGFVVLFLLIFSYLGVSIYLLSRKNNSDKIISLALFSASIILIAGVLFFKASGPSILIGYLFSVLALVSVILNEGIKEKYFNLSLKTSPKYALPVAFIFVVFGSAIIFSFIFLGKIFIGDVLAGMAVRSSSVNGEKTVNMMQKAILFNPKEGRYYTRLGQEYLILTNKLAIGADVKNNADAIEKNLNNSIDSLSKGKELTKNDLSAMEGLAQAYENAGLYVFESNKKALENYKEAAELDPNNPNLQIKIAEMRMIISGEMDEGEQKKAYLRETKNILEKAIELKSNLSFGYYNLALVKEKMEELDESVGDMEKALTLNPSDMNVFFNLGRLYQKRSGEEDLKKAEAIFEKILEIKNEDINANFSLGLLFEKTNRINESIAQYQKVVSILESGQQNEISKKNIEQINAMISNIQRGQSNDAQQAEDGSLENQEQGASEAEIIEEGE
jgi:tetratricopeptide (TPR) repeat protein